MKIQFHKNFEKQYKKLTPKLKLKIKERNVVFAADPFHSSFNNHALKGIYTGYRSINITGDFRMIYKLIGNDIALFVAIGSHSKLYQ